MLFLMANLNGNCPIRMIIGKDCHINVYSDVFCLVLFLQRSLCTTGESFAPFGCADHKKCNALQ